MDTPQNQNEWTQQKKIIFLVQCCLTATWFASLRDGHLGIEDFCEDHTMDSLFQIAAPPTLLLSIVLFVIVSCLSVWSDIRRGASVSWAVLAYGLWMTIPCLMLFCMFWYAAGASAFTWAWYIGAFIAALVLIQSGIRAALHDRWDRVLFWWRLSFVWIFFFFPFWFKAPHAAEERYLDRLHDATTELSTNPTWAERL